MNDFENLSSTRDPLPTYGNESANPYSNVPSNNIPRPDVEDCVNSAFGKALASVIMAWFPITCIISIFLSSGALKLVAQANQLAANYGIGAPGKNIAAKVLGTIGKISSIIMTVIYGLYFLLIFSLLGSL